MARVSGDFMSTLFDRLGGCISYICGSYVCVATSPKLLASLVSSHLIHLPESCPIQPVRRLGDKKGSANALVLPHGSGAISEACVFVVRITRSRQNLPQGCVSSPYYATL